MEFLVNGTKYTDYEEAKKAEAAYHKTIAAEEKQKKKNGYLAKLYRILNEHLTVAKLTFTENGDTRYIAVLTPNYSEKESWLLAEAIAIQKYGPVCRYTNIDDFGIRYEIQNAGPNVEKNIKNQILDIIRNERPFIMPEMALSDKITLCSSFNINNLDQYMPDNNNTTEKSTDEPEAETHTCGGNCNSCRKHEKEEQPQPSVIHTPFGDLIAYRISSTDDIGKFLHNLFG